MLETVIGTGLLILGLAVIGAQFQDSETSIRKMQRRFRAIELAEQYLAELDLGLIELDSVDEVQEEDFGPRFPDYGWRLITEPTAIEGMYRLTVEVLFIPRADKYQEDDFDHENAETLFTAYAFRPVPQKLDLEVDYGLKDEELERVTQTLGDTGIPGLDVSSFDPSILAKLDFEQMVKVLPIVLDAMHLELGDLEAMIPPEILKQIKESGALDEIEGLGDKDGQGGKGAGGGP